MKYRNFIAAVVMASALLAGVAVAQTKGKQRSQSARVEITKMGYEPVSISLKRGIPAQITFVRMTDSTCAKEVVFPDHGINRPLPLNTPVTIRLTPKKPANLLLHAG